MKILNRLPIISLACIAAISLVVSAAINLVIGFGSLLEMAPYLFAILTSNYILIKSVSDILTRKTPSGKWAELVYFLFFMTVLVGTYGAIFAKIGLKDGEIAQSHDTWTGLYFSVITWTTVGYGDVTASQPAARLFSILEAINSYLVLALFIAAMVPVFHDLIQKRRE